MTLETATFGAGCFWGVEETFRNVDGVKETAVGYSGGTVEHASYEQVCTGTTGHAEVVEVQFDPSVVTYAQLVDLFFQLHDPTQLNRQGPDHGTQYRSAIFYHDESQKAAAESAIQRLTEANAFPRPIVTQVEQAHPFWRAEEYHQQYLAKRGMRSCHI